MPRQSKERTERFLPGGVPRWVRCYDNGGESADRYTVVYTGRYRQRTGGEFWYRGMSAAPYHPQGVGILGSHSAQIDRPRSSHLGKRIKFEDLPADCKQCVISDYCYLWDIRGVDAEADRLMREDDERNA